MCLLRISAFQQSNWVAKGSKRQKIASLRPFRELQEVSDTFIAADISPDRAQGRNVLLGGARIESMV